MASVVGNILTGGALQGIAQVIDAIKGKNPGDAAKLQELAMQYQAEFSQSQVRLQEDQIEVDKTEAASGSTFTSGARPFILWVCGVGLATEFIARPWMTFFVSLVDHYRLGVTVVFPVVDMTSLFPLILGMLGMSAAHMWENIKLNGGK